MIPTRGGITFSIKSYLPAIMPNTLTSKAQVTLPKAIRDHLRVAPGDAVEFRIVADGSVRVEPAAPVADSPRALAAARAKFGKLRGCGGRSGEAGTDALMRLLRGYDDDAADPGLEPVATRRRA
ncbi:AbrB/MazE/SpoVT family DNA-binding domain-containing protein [Aquabacterium humicola]|uniref:AbrB/MazE/SpoVT family DNA-binding domain-containing protein n=1 Tax=Aquabacterium humicola TaxID=3237377 RepID=UPI0025437BD9|nr:AbrB/MazE/SpoVT family DNA-binding domain-containing protein [Rubrivivax pictus]